MGEASVVDPESGCIFTLWLNTDLTFTPEATPAPNPQPTPDPKPTPQPGVKPAVKPATTTATTKTVEKTTQAKKGDAVLATTGDTTAMTVAALGIAGATVAAAGLAATKRRKHWSWVTALVLGLSKISICNTKPVKTAPDVTD